jgi:glutamyl-tRNA reductase
LPAELLIVGLSHQTAPIEIRERLAIEPGEIGAELGRVMERTGLSEGVLVSTCNRVEVIGAAIDGGTAAQGALDCLNRRAAPDTVDAFVYRHRSADAVRHLFRVAAGLEAMVLGEPQILGQVKEALSAAQEAGTVGTLLGRWFDRAFQVAKRVRTETGIAAGHVSVSSIACHLTERIFGELGDRRVLLLGSGEMAEDAAHTLTAHGSRLFMIDKDPERARRLSETHGGTPRPLEALAGELAAADVVISSTSDPGFVITRELMREAVGPRKRRPLFFIDIAVPRDVDPAVGTFDNVFLYDIDDLEKVSEENLGARQREIPAAEAIVEDAVRQFQRWLHSLQLSPTIVALRERFRAVVLAEKERTLSRFPALGEDERRSLDAMCEAIVNKLLHRPLTELKRGGSGREAAELIAAAQRLFRLEIPESRGEEPAAEADGGSSQNGETPEKVEA